MGVCARVRACMRAAGGGVGGWHCAVGGRADGWNDAACGGADAWHRAGAGAACGGGSIRCGNVIELRQQPDPGRSRAVESKVR